MKIHWLSYTLHAYIYSLTHWVCVCVQTRLISAIFLYFQQFSYPCMILWHEFWSFGHYWDLCCADFPNVDRFHYVASTTVCSLTSPLTTSPLTTAGELFKYWQQMWFPKFWFLLGGSNFITGNQYFKLIFLIWQAHSVTVLDNTCYIPKSELTWFITQSFFQGRMVFYGKSS